MQAINDKFLTLIIHIKIFKIIKIDNRYFNKNIYTVHRYFFNELIFYGTQAVPLI